MTQNQIRYQELKETTRHNQEMEAQGRSGLQETGRHNVATEKETSRHNVVTERETTRHNVITEVETNRHNRVTEDLGYENLKLGYSNLAETSRHNQATEAIGREQLSIGWATVGAKHRELDQRDFVNSFYPAEVQIKRLSAQAQMNSAAAAALNANANMMNASVNQQMMPYNMIVQDSLANKYNADAELDRSKAITETYQQTYLYNRTQGQILANTNYDDLIESQIWGNYLHGAGSAAKAGSDLISVVKASGGE